MNTTSSYVPNHLVWAILSTLFCCLPLGIVSIVFAAQVNGKLAAGDVAGALRLWEADLERGLGELNFPPDYPKMPGEPPRVPPSRRRTGRTRPRAKPASSSKQGLANG